MPPIDQASKSLAHLLFRCHWTRDCSWNYKQIKCFGTHSATRELPATTHKDGYQIRNLSRNHASFHNQKRIFFGWGDVQGGMLSKVSEERPVLGYSTEQLFNVAAAVDMYQEFLPWCQRSDITRRNPDGTLDAELEIGFNFFVESYLSQWS